MTNEKLMQAESSARQHHQHLEHISRMYTIGEAAEMNLFLLLKPTLQQDGDQWCVLYGDDLQVGIVGFGDTPRKAIREWTKEWDKKAVVAPKREE